MAARQQEFQIFFYNDSPCRSAIFGHPLFKHVPILVCARTANHPSHAQPRVARVTCSMLVSSLMLSADPRVRARKIHEKLYILECLVKCAFSQRKSGLPSRIQSGRLRASESRLLMNILDPRCRLTFYTIAYRA